MSNLQTLIWQRNEISRCFEPAAAAVSAAFRLLSTLCLGLFMLLLFAFILATAAFATVMAQSFQVFPRDALRLLNRMSG